METRKPVCHGGVLSPGFEVATVALLGCRTSADAAGEEWRRARDSREWPDLAIVLAQSAALSAAEVADKILFKVRKWATRPDDDYTVIVCDLVQGSPEVDP